MALSVNRFGIGRRRATSGLLLLMLLLGATGCGRSLRNAPVSATPQLWPTLLGNLARTGYAGESVADEMQVVWRREIGPGLESSLLLDGPVLFAIGSNQVVAALSAESGELFWRQRSGGARVSGPVRSDDRLIVGVSDRPGQVLALDPRNGKRVWSRDVGPVAFAPTLQDGVVYAGTDAGLVVALDEQSGEVLWRTGLAGRITATPVPWREHLLLATATDTLYLLDRSDGAVRHRAALGDRVSATPALRGDTLLLPTRSGRVAAVALPDLAIVWQVDVGSAVLAAPVAAPDGALYLLNLSAELWRLAGGASTPERLAALGGAATGSLTFAGDRLLVGRLDGTLLLLETDGSVVWTTDLEDSIVAPVTVRDGAIYVPLRRGSVVKLR